MSSLAEYQAGQPEEQCKGEGRGEGKAVGAQQLCGEAPGTPKSGRGAASSTAGPGPGPWEPWLSATLIHKPCHPAPFWGALREISTLPAG